MLDYYSAALSSLKDLVLEGVYNTCTVEIEKILIQTSIKIGKNPSHNIHTQIIMSKTFRMKVPYDRNSETNFADNRNTTFKV